MSPGQMFPGQVSQTSPSCELRLHAKFQLPRLCKSQKMLAVGGWVAGGYEGGGLIHV